MSSAALPFPLENKKRFDYTETKAFPQYIERKMNLCVCMCVCAFNGELSSGCPCPTLSQRQRQTGLAKASRTYNVSIAIVCADPTKGSTPWVLELLMLGTANL